MLRDTISLHGVSFPVLAVNTAVIGSGCAGFNAADWLYDLGRKDIALLTEGLYMGTSRNTGSDKQTYYKLTLAGDTADSVSEMAADLFAGEGVNGDTALAEAASSARSFIKLANLGVPFPTDAYGSYVGYKTDHDPRQRATSAGPLTSRYMTEALEASVRKKNIPILDGWMAVKLLVSSEGVEGALCISTDPSKLASPSRGFCILRAKQIILATGGPAGCYLHSVYPESQTGMSGMALEAGAQGSNLHLWQYGLASVKFRWNVSGTYQQVLPRYISVDPQGNETELLLSYFEDPKEALLMEFRKGYEWPFDTEKLPGSSLIDCIVQKETSKGNRVYMDFRRNPSGLEEGFQALDEEVYTYLKNSHALLETPFARLEKMNPQAIALYRSHHIDLEKEPLEIRVCAQHHNGGLAVDADWQTTIPGLYAAGEAAGTFGKKRPGGSALNSAQVGSLRAAEHIAYTTPDTTDLPKEFLFTAEKELALLFENVQAALNQTDSSLPSPLELRQNAAERMSLFAGMLRNPAKMQALQEDLQKQLSSLYETVYLKSPAEIPFLLKTWDLFITMQAVLSSMLYSAENSATLGSGLVPDEEGVCIHPLLPEFRYKKPIPLDGNMVLSTHMDAGQLSSFYIPVRPIPEPDSWFENVWAEYRKRTSSLSSPFSENTPVQNHF